MIIGLVGFKKVGKSTAAKYLEDKYSFVRHNFKDALVAEIKEKFPDLLQSLVELYKQFPELWKSEGADKPSKLPVTIDNLFEVKPVLVRNLMKNYGNEVRRGDKPGYWVDKWTTKLWEMGSDVNVVTDDVRFIDEASRVKGQAGIIIRLTRPDMLTGGDHSSETEQLQIEADYTIECEAGDFETLYRRLDEIIKSGDNQ